MLRVHVTMPCKQSVSAFCFPDHPSTSLQSVQAAISGPVPDCLASCFHLRLICEKHSGHRLCDSFGAPHPGHNDMFVLFFNPLWALRMLFLECETFFFGTANKNGGKSSTSESMRPRIVCVTSPPEIAETEEKSTAVMERCVGEISLAGPRDTIAGNVREKNVGRMLVRREGPAVA